MFWEEILKVLTVLSFRIFFEHYRISISQVHIDQWPLSQMRQLKHHAPSVKIPPLIFLRS